MLGWLDCAAGASGDMMLGALVAAGVPVEHLSRTLAGLPVEPIGLRVEQTSRHSIGAVRVHVDTPESHHHRRFADIRRILTEAELPAPVRDDALAAFGALARAEAAVHHTDPEDVHFHEVGALDAIADIVGACAGVHWLREHRGLTGLTAGTLTLGGGQARGAHGAIPIPGPAVLEIVAGAGIPVRGGGLPHEACTPTGAALVATLAAGFGPLPPMRVRHTGVGAGGRDPEETANVLRLVLGDPLPAGPDEPEEPAEILECNVDDLDPRLWPPVLAALLDAGAADAWLTPILMKKGRPAHTLHVLCRPADAAALRAVVYAHTSTIGLRSHRVAKFPLDREQATVEVDGAHIRVKLARHGGAVVNVSVEYEDVVAAAAARGEPPKLLLARATAAAHRLAAES